MPITENGYEYQMPQNIKEAFTQEFLVDFKNRVVEVFQENDRRQGREASDYHQYAYYEWWAYMESTSGFCMAFEATCQKHNLTDILEYYKQLPWYDSDIFDYEVGHLLVEKGLIEEGDPNALDEDEEESLEN